jgi:hypothetical protein
MPAMGDGAATDGPARRDRQPDTTADFSRLRFLEIGAPWLKSAFPAQTTCFSTEHSKRDADPGNGLHSATLATLPALHRALRDPALSLVVCRPPFFPPWHWQWIIRHVFSRRLLRGEFRALGGLAPQLLRAPIKAPIAVLDFEDYPGIKRDRLWLMSRCRLYFKRELPLDHWRVFMNTAHPNLPSRRFRMRQRHRDLIAKLRPLPLGLPTRSYPTAAEKTADIFYAGDTESSSTVRSAGIAELMALRDRGVTVDIPQTRLPPDEFLRRAASAWLVWSPEGLGWDCFRHYEALACGSVPVISRPAIERHQPLIAGEHALYYDIEPGGLTGVIQHALADKDRLRAMAQAGSAYVLAHHTREALARHVIAATLGLDNPA